MSAATPCPDEDECKHVHDARARWHSRRACTHRLTFDHRIYEDGWLVGRECFFCGEGYDRTARVLEPLRALCLRRWSLSGVESPWTADERSEDPS